MDTDDNASVSSSNEISTSLGGASNKLLDEVDDEGFFDKAVVSPSESGTSTPPPSSDSEAPLGHQEESRSFMSADILSAT